MSLLRHFSRRFSYVTKERNHIAVWPLNKDQHSGVFKCIRLSNDEGMEMEILNYGGIIQSLRVPTRNGNKINIVPKLSTIDEWMDNKTYFNGIAGRYANRIANGKFQIDNTEYQLSINNGENHLHGGTIGFMKRLWNYELIDNDEVCGVSLNYVSPDGEEGYPGELNTTVSYLLYKDYNQFMIRYNANTNKKTIVNLTNHAYFNLNGTFNDNDVLDHYVKINADYFIPIDQYSIPLGELRRVVNTPFEFRHFKQIGQDIQSNDIQLLNGKGYSHNYVLTESFSDNYQDVPCAELLSYKSGIHMKMYTTEPGMQLYTASFLDSNTTYNNETGEKYGKWGSVCLETQHYPDCPNNPEWPSTVLSPGEEFSSETLYTFENVKVIN